MEREQLQALLVEGVVTVTFTKVNGDERVMKCTKKNDLIPQESQPSGKMDNTELSAEVMRVFDVEANGWRSFRLDSIKSVETSA